MNRALQPGAYVRYVDDFLLFGESKAELNGALARVRNLFDSLRVRLHPGKSRLHRTVDGITFRGWRIFPGRARLCRGNVVRFRRRLRRMRDGFELGLIGWDDVRPRVLAWIAHAGHGETWKLRKQVFEQNAFGARSAV